MTEDVSRPSSTTSDEPKASEDNSNGLAILDFLFTFSLGGGLVPEAFGGHGLLSEQWVQSMARPSSEELGEALTLLFGILTLTFSWYGYHESIRQRPHRSGTWQGFVRFQIDVVLTLLYGALLLMMRMPEWAMITGAIIYLLYTVWDCVAGIEYRDYMPRGGWKLSLGGFTTFSLLSLMVWYCFIPAIASALIAILINIMYRVMKITGEADCQRLAAKPPTAI